MQTVMHNVMKNPINISTLIQSHKGVANFDYDLTVDWAIELLRSGIETENIYMLASFSKPVDSREIKPYVSAVLKDLNLVENEGNDAVISKIKYHLVEIIHDHAIRSNLKEIYNICIQNGYPDDLMKFYLLYNAWDELDSMDVNFYYDGATKSNIEEIIKDKARNWLDENAEK